MSELENSESISPEIIKKMTEALGLPSEAAGAVADIVRGQKNMARELPSDVPEPSLCTMPLDDKGNLVPPKKAGFER